MSTLPENPSEDAQLPHHRRRSTSSSTGYTASTVMITPPMSPSYVQASMASTLRRPIPANLGVAVLTPPYTQSSGNNNHLQHPAPSVNPYSRAGIGANGFTQPPPDYYFVNHSFDISSGPTSPTSPPLHPAYPLAAAGDESLFDRWLRHEDMSRPIFPSSRTGSSVATSDISSVRGGMFGSLPGGRAVGSSRRGPGSVTSAATRDRDTFTTSTPSYPSSRAGGSRPNSRDGDAPSVSAESYPPSVVSTEAYTYSIGAMVRDSIRAPPPVPTPPVGSTAPGSEISSSAASMWEREGAITPTSVRTPEPAAMRPPRYSDPNYSTAYGPGLADLLNRGVVGYYPGPPMVSGGPTDSEKARLRDGGGAVVMVQEDVWQELRRLAGLDPRIPPAPLAPAPPAPAVIAPTAGTTSNGFDVDLEKGEAEPARKRRRRRMNWCGDDEKETGCFGFCVIC